MIPRLLLVCATLLASVASADLPGHTITQKWNANHGEVINAVAFSQETGVAVSAGGSYDFGIRVWDLNTGDLLRTLTGHTGSVLCLAITPDGSTLVSGSRDYTVKVWDLAQGTLLRTLTGHSHYVYGVAVTSDGETIVSGSRDQTAKVWRLSDGLLWRTLVGHTGEVRAVAVDPGKQFVVTTANDQYIKIWKLSDGALLHSFFSSSNAGFGGLAVSPDSKRLAAIGGGSTIDQVHIWDISAEPYKYRSLPVLCSVFPCIQQTGHTATIRSISMGSQGKTLVSSSWDETIIVWSLTDSVKLHTVRGHTGDVRSVVLSPDGGTILSGGSDSSVIAWTVDPPLPWTYPSLITDIQRHPEQLALHAARPNPFNPSTSIRYTLPASEHISLRVYSITGRRVRTLVTGTMAAGSYEAVWDGRDEDGHLLGSGVYVYRLEGTGWSRAHRVTLIR